MLVTISFDPEVFQIEVGSQILAAVTLTTTSDKHGLGTHSPPASTSHSVSGDRLLQVKAEDSVASIKETLEGVSGIPVQHQLLIHDGKELASRCVKCSVSVTRIVVCSALPAI